MTKKNIVYSLMASAMLVLGACANAPEEASTIEPETATEQAEEPTETSEVVYFCPMKCEGETTYSEPGKCSVCGMDLVEKK